MPCKNKLDALYFVVASFTWLLWASRKYHSCLRHKTTTVIYQVCCFNLQQGPAIVKFDSTKVGETEPASHLYAKLVAYVCRWNRSHQRGHVRLVRVALSNNIAESK